MSFKKLLEKRENKTLKYKSVGNLSKRLKEYEKEFKEERKQLEPSKNFYNFFYDI